MAAKTKPHKTEDNKCSSDATNRATNRVNYSDNNLSPRVPLTLKPGVVCAPIQSIKWQHHDEYGAE